ncbi:sigma-70 family RNA polymerase sigma factor [Streptomyces longisporus]|uniref:Sigma-70 family RNA polymerase sigma factor n=1 Tax=Streptomyces longisporus TaxID=1948 RepID=A0ABN3NKG3_STRLO
MTVTDTTTRPASEAERPVVAIVDAARGGDREAFGVLYARYRPQIYTYLWRRTHDRELSEDLTADVFVRALARIEAFTWRGSDFGAWLATIARNLLLDHYKSFRHRREVATGDMRDQDLAVGDVGEQVTEQLAKADVLAELRKALGGLTPDQWQCLWLRYWHDLPFGEIGQRMDRSTFAVKMLKERALQNLSAPEIKAALLNAASSSPSQACAAPQTSPRIPSPRRTAPSPHLDSGRTRPMATDAMPATLPPLTASQAVALVLLRDGLTERSITHRTSIGGDTLYRLAAAHGITAPHGTVEGHRCHEAASTDPCDGCSLADSREQARALARQRKTITSLPYALRRQVSTARTGYRKAAG